MSPIALILNLLLGGLLLAALALGVRLDRRLRALRDSQAGFIKAVNDLDNAALRTQAGLQQWREAADEARELLHDRTEKAKVQAARLDKLLADAARVPDREAAREPAQSFDQGRERAPRRPILDLTRQDAMRMAGAESPRPDPARAEALTREILTREILGREPIGDHVSDAARAPAGRVEPPRARVQIDDDLFEAGPSPALRRRDPRSPPGGPR